MSKSGPANDEETAMKETPQVVDKKVQSKAPLPRQDTGAPSMAEKATIDGIKQLLKNDKSKTRFDALEMLLKEAVVAFLQKEYVVSMLKVPPVTEVERAARRFAEEIVSRERNQMEEEILNLMTGEDKNRPAETVASPVMLGQYKYFLTFSHECNHYGCQDSQCLLCSQAQERRCQRNFSEKYMVGEHLSASCHQNICVEMCKNPDSVEDEKMGELFGSVEYWASLIDSKFIEKDPMLVSSNIEDSRIKLAPNGSPIMSNGSTSSVDGKLRLNVMHGHLTISDIIIHGSSESTLHGHKPKYILIVEAYYSSDGKRAYEIAPLASEPFVVTSVRVRSTRKKAIPHVDDDISKVKCLGHATQEKLRTLQDLVLRNPSLLGCPFHSINKVGEFRMLLSWSDENPKQCLALKKALNLTRGWDEARAHALSAVCDDFMARVWLNNDKTQGLAFGCMGGIPKLDVPLATIKISDSRKEYLFTHHSLVGQQFQDRMVQSQPDMHISKMTAEARNCWFKQRHPGWTMIPMHSSNFELVLQTHKITSLPIDMVTEDFSSNVNASLDVMKILSGTPVGTQSLEQPKVLKRPRDYQEDLTDRQQSLKLSARGLQETSFKSTDILNLMKDLVPGSKTFTPDNILLEQGHSTGLGSPLASALVRELLQGLDNSEIEKLTSVSKFQNSLTFTPNASVLPMKDNKGKGEALDNMSGSLRQKNDENISKALTLEKILPPGHM